MLTDDKVKHIEATQKQVTSICFDACFNTKKLKVDFEKCVPTCYQKYLFSVNLVRENLEARGREVKSQFVIEAVGHETRDRFKDEIFPPGGHSA